MMVLSKICSHHIRNEFIRLKEWRKTPNTGAIRARPLKEAYNCKYFFRVLESVTNKRLIQHSAHFFTILKEKARKSRRSLVKKTESMVCKTSLIFQRKAFWKIVNRVIGQEITKKDLSREKMRVLVRICAISNEKTEILGLINKLMSP